MFFKSVMCMQFSGSASDYLNTIILCGSELDLNQE